MSDYRGAFQPGYDFDNLVAIRLEAHLGINDNELNELATDTFDSLVGCMIDSRQMVASLDLRTGLFQTYPHLEEEYGPSFGDVFYDNLTKYFGTRKLIEETFNSLRFTKAQAKAKFLKHITKIEKRLNKLKEEVNSDKGIRSMLEYRDDSVGLNDMERYLENAGPIDIMNVDQCHNPCEWGQGMLCLTSAGYTEQPFKPTHVVFIAYLPLQEED